MREIELIDNGEGLDLKGVEEGCLTLDQIVPFSSFFKYFSSIEIVSKKKGDGNARILIIDQKKIEKMTNGGISWKHFIKKTSRFKQDSGIHLVFKVLKKEREG